jgi:hypothetical protein
VFDDTTLKSNQKLLMLAIADNASDQEGEFGTCYPSIKTLMLKCGLSNRAVINNLDSLIKKGVLKKAYRSRKKGGRSSNKYLIYPEQNFNNLDESNQELFTQSEECSQGKATQSEEYSQGSTKPKVKNVHRGSEECSQGKATQSEECSQESEPSLKDINHQYNHHLDIVLDSEERELFDEYLEIRKELKLKTTDSIKKRLLNKFIDFGRNKDVIKNAINANWKDFYQVRQNKVTPISKHNGFSERDYSVGASDESISEKW